RVEGAGVVEAEKAARRDQPRQFSEGEIGELRAVDVQQAAAGALARRHLRDQLARQGGVGGGEAWKRDAGVMTGYGGEAPEIRARGSIQESMSTVISLASGSTAPCNSSFESAAGTRSTALTLNVCSALAISTFSVCISSMLT